MQKTLKILFEGDPLIASCLYDANRTGIFFVTFNILKELTERTDVAVSVFSTEFFDLTLLKKFLSENNLSNVDIIMPNWCLALYERLKILKRLKKNQRQYARYLGIKFLTICLFPVYRVVKFFDTTLKNAARHFDLALSAMNKLPDFTIPKYIVLHDCIPSILPKYFKHSGWYRQLLQSLNHNDYYFSVSENTKKDFIKLKPVIDPNKMYVIPLAASENFKPASDKAIKQARLKYQIPDGKYVFSLCTLEPRKNLLRIVRTFAAFLEKHQLKDWYLVLGGTHWKEFIDQLNQEIKQTKYLDKIIKIGYVEDEDLAPLYSGSEWFVYTSEYEGFGLPPLEAMSCGCPVITSNNSSLPEVVGDAGIMIDFDSDEQHIKAYESYYNDPDLRHSNAEKGLIRAKQFSWKKSVDRMVTIMKSNLDTE